MKRLKLALFLFLGLHIFFSGNADALDADFRGKLTGWTIESKDHGDWINNSGLRYLPQLTLGYTLSDEAFIDAEISANGFVSYNSKDSEEDSDVELYRLKLRFATAQTETRLGLQRINFGPAQLLRSLKWFDQLDPRDPLQLTDGVYGVRFTYNALNNANIWLWGLYDNDERKGYEKLSSVDNKPEFGGRLQYPVFNGELAATCHTRSVDASSLGEQDFRETRFALDGRWEIEIGMWFETVLQHQDTKILPHRWMKMTTLGVDYTFGIGNGINVVVEHLAIASSDDAFGWDEDAHTSAFSVSYPVGFFDNFSAIGYYSWKQEEYSQHLRWQRTYDTWEINLSLFYYPESENDIDEFTTTKSLGSGYGGQLMLSYHH